ncbi:unnamed protein product [Phyllotreta striolata]|uniref:acid phosphatase n=1 Tax=Phyllotreta striolata TaxID=444603 RepID=A0A9N9TJD2_PHYSR|nr:unnamed protein product [Phyllotreta striolata]
MIPLWPAFLFSMLLMIYVRQVLTLADPSSELITVVAVFRHGDRAPLRSWPNDIYFDDKYWPNGLTQLTEKGKIRAHSLGKWFRKYYRNFTSDIYSPKDIYMYSTDVDRCLMSAQSFLLGLYPPKGYQVWNEAIPWQPIPVHTAQRHKDDVVLDKRPCPKHKKLYQQAKRAVYKNLEEKYKVIYDTLKEYTGWANITPELVEDFVNQIYVYDNYNKTFIPDWAKKVYCHPDVKYLAYLALQTSTSTKTLARLKIGPFFHKIICHFENFTCGAPNAETGPKFYAFSCHDSCLIHLMNAMGVYDSRQIGFSDSLIFELRKSRDGNFYVNLVYRRHDGKQEWVEDLTMNECGFDCDYIKFKDLMSEITVHIDEREKECREIVS